MNHNLLTVIRTPWQPNFPDTIIDRKLGDATSHIDYIKAKSGAIEPAYRLANDLVTESALQELEKLVKNQNVVIAPIHAEEAMGRNMIPLAVATVIAKRLRLTVDVNVVQAVKVSRTGADGWRRLANSPSFDGKIEGNNSVIMIDDTQTQGGTFASFKGHIEYHGNEVIGAYALTGKQYSKQLRLDNEVLQQLRQNYGKLEKFWQEKFGYGFDKLTQWEAKFILNSGKSIEQVRDCIITAKQS